MGVLTRFTTFAAAVTLVTFVEAAFAIDTADASPETGDSTTVALGAHLRNCDFSRVNVAVMIPRPPAGSGSAVIRSNGARVAAEIKLLDPDSPDTHYDVGLIQLPRPTSGCGPGDAGVTFASLDLNAAGEGSVAIHDAVDPGTTSVWIVVQRPHTNAQHPVEYYTSEFPVPV